VYQSISLYTNNKGETNLATVYPSIRDTMGVINSDREKPNIGSIKEGTNLATVYELLWELWNSDSKSQFTSYQVEYQNDHCIAQYTSY
jgi:hypothetical protein